MTWDRSGIAARGSHALSFTGDIQFRTMSSVVTHQRIRIEDDMGRLRRSIDFDPRAAAITAHDTRAGAGVRDLWDVTDRLQLDLDLRIDGIDTSAGVTPSPRIGARYALDGDARTTLKASAGRFVGRPPLGSQAFDQFPARLDRSFDPTTGALRSAVRYGPATQPLDLPRANGIYRSST